MLIEVLYRCNAALLINISLHDVKICITNLNSVTTGKELNRLPDVFVVWKFETISGIAIEISFRSNVFITLFADYTAIQERKLIITSTRPDF